MRAAMLERRQARPSTIAACYRDAVRGPGAAPAA